MQRYCQGVKGIDRVPSRFVGSHLASVVLASARASNKSCIHRPSRRTRCIDAVRHRHSASTLPPSCLTPKSTIVICFSSANLHQESSQCSVLSLISQCKGADIASTTKHQINCTQSTIAVHFVPGLCSIGFDFAESSAPEPLKSGQTRT